MGHATARALFLGEAANSLFRVRRLLESLHCTCTVALGVEQALALAASDSFDLLLSIHPLHLASPLIPRIERSRCSAFYRLPVEDGFWWVPILDRGSPCLGAPALRPAEFLEAIERIVNEAQLAALAQQPNSRAVAA